MKNVWTALSEERIFMKKTKIVCTLGPATDDDNVLRELIKSGMDCARFNFSHGTHEDHKKRYEQVERIRKELRLPIPAILDTKGPEVRIKSFKRVVVQLLNRLLKMLFLAKNSLGLENLVKFLLLLIWKKIILKMRFLRFM